MAKMTINGLQTFVQTYVSAAKQAGAWNATTDNLIGLLDKVGKQITIDGRFNDPLVELSGDDLPLAKTIEEYFIDLVIPQDFDETGKNALAPSYPSVEDVAYSYTLGRKVIKTSVPYDNVERAALSSADAGNMIAKIIERLTNSRSLYTYSIKKQLLGNFATKAVEATGLDQVIAAPSDTQTGEAFIKQVKEDIENASFAGENKSLSKTLIGAAPSLTLYIKKGVMPSIQVDTMAGAFNREDLGLDCSVKVVDDFGKADDNIYAILIDPRGVKLHRGYQATREMMNGEGDFLSLFDHSEYTGFISKHSFIKVYKQA